MLSKLLSRNEKKLLKAVQQNDTLIIAGGPRSGKTTPKTSVTIPGIKYVIDPGVGKARIYDGNAGIESLDVEKVSKAQAIQGRGCAGCESLGKCYRLYPEAEFDKFEDSTTPEIERCDLSLTILHLKAQGFDDITGFDFIDKPNSTDIFKSLESLHQLGALTEERKLTDSVGREIRRIDRRT